MSDRPTDEDLEQSVYGRKAQRYDGWSDYELQCLYDAVNDIDWFPRVAPLLRQRSENAIRTKMSLLRREAGIAPRQSGPKARSTTAVTRDDAKTGSDRLLRAIEAAAA